jgi:Zn-dependent peptidase ImmA (M78 family)
MKKRRAKMCKGVVNEIRNRNIQTDEEIRSAAQQILAEYKIKDGKIPVVQIINDAGFKTYTLELPNTIGGFIILNNELVEKFGSDKVIVVNSQENLNRQRFSFAHEFGHYLLDNGAKENVEYSDSYSFSAFESDANKSEVEKRMDRFAAELLMPFEDFKQKYEEIKDQHVHMYDVCNALADYFSVPSVAVKKRFEEVGLVL